MKTFLVCSFIAFVAAEYQDSNNDNVQQTYGVVNQDSSNSYNVQADPSTSYGMNNGYDNKINYQPGYGENSKYPQYPHYPQYPEYPEYPHYNECSRPRYFTIKGNTTRRFTYEAFDTEKSKVAYVGCPNDENLYAIVAKQFKGEEDISGVSGVVTLGYGSNFYVQLKCHRGRYFAKSAITDEYTKVNRLACLKITKDGLADLTKNNTF